ncbi:hypothetical protein B0H14DRAFT_3529327 [Mycena olivaceomarginata]|nr:hypothetical protein B0H14DRAFT_3529327 [Mycena olivaceomarginata]
MASPHSAGLVYRLLLYPSKNLNINAAEFLDHPLFQAQTLVPYVSLRQRSVHKPMEFIKLALSLAQQAGDIELQLLSMQTEPTAAQVCGDPHWGIAVSRKAWKIARFTTNYWEQCCTEWEAWGACHSVDLSRALDLCAHGEELLISDGMQGSDRYLEFLDTRAEVNFQQTNYLESRRLYKQIADMTPPTRSPWFHVYSLTMIAHIDILTECEVAGILESINAAQALYRGDTQNAWASLIACLSKGPCYSA